MQANIRFRFQLSRTWNWRKIYLNVMTIWPFEETGFAFSRYAVKLSSRQRTSACVEPGGNLGDLGELGVVCEAVATMLHIGQPAFGANEAMLIKLQSAA